MLRHKALLDNVGLDPQLILNIQLGEDEETKMCIPHESVASYRAKHHGLFPEADDLAAIKAKAEGTHVGKKRRR